MVMKKIVQNYDLYFIKLLNFIKLKNNIFLCHRYDYKNKKLDVH